MIKINNSLRSGEFPLKNISIFKNCKESEINNLLSDKTVYEFQKNELLIEQGTPFNGVLCIQAGVAKIFKTGKKQNDFIFWYAQPGDLVGLDAYINKENYSLSALAIEKVQTNIIDEQDLNNIIKYNPDISIEMMKSMCEKIELIENRMASIAQKEIKEQLAEILLLFSSKNKGTNDIIDIYYTVNDLANIIGTTKSYIYKILSDFSQRKIIIIQNKRIKIINVLKLSKVASGN